ncbi:MAG: hypothetical protein WCW13_02520 [archaeon]|jgi:hypothetical protein
MKKICLLFVIGLLLLFFGCTNISPEDIALANSQISNYLTQHPDAVLRVSPYYDVNYEMEKDFWEKNCPSEIKKADYYLASAEDETTKLRALFDREQVKLRCIIIEEKASPTKPIINQVTTKPKTCSSLGGTQCTIEQQCSGNWITSTDSIRCCDKNCIMPIKKDPCEGAKIVTCSPTAQKCIEEMIADGKNCGCTKCDELSCNTVKTINCGTNETCIESAYSNGKSCGCTKCQSVTCSDKGGQICNTGFSCQGSITSAADTTHCCVGVCYKVDVTYKDANSSDTN